VYAVSATLLQGVYLGVPRDWGPEERQAYESLRSARAAWDDASADPLMLRQLRERHGEEFWRRTFETLGRFEFSALTAYLRGREPDAMPGYSIAVYRLGDEEIRRALDVGR
jgi:hypothetical protein